MSSYCLKGFVSMTIILASPGDGDQSDEVKSPFYKGFFIENFRITAGKQSMKKGGKPTRDCLSSTEPIY